MIKRSLIATHILVKSYFSSTLLSSTHLEPLQQ
jgi:hypothetical protein